MIVLHAGFHDDSYVIRGEREIKSPEFDDKDASATIAAETSEVATAPTKSSSSSKGKKPAKRQVDEQSATPPPTLPAESGSAAEQVRAHNKSGKSSKDSSASKAGTKVSKAGGKSSFHPYALEYRELIDTINGTAADAIFTGADARTLNIWLPSTGAGPVPSDSLYLENAAYMLEAEGEEKPNGKRSLKLFEVNAVAMEGARFVAFIEHTHGRHILKSGVHLSNEFDFFFRMLQFSASMVVRQQYLPTIKARGRNLVAAWDPVLAGDDHFRLIQLADQMPYSIRAVCPGTLAEQKHKDYGRQQPLALSRLETTIALSQGFLDGLVKRSIQQVEKEREAQNADSTRSEKADVAFSHTAAFESRYGHGRKSQTDSAAELRGLPHSEFESVHGCWLHGLRIPSGKLDFDRTQLTKFIGELADWQMPATAFNAAPFRLCFHLEEPNYVYEELEFISEEVLQAKWKVHYLLQSTIDPSLMIPAAQAWQNSHDMRIAFADNQFRPREYLLLSLAKSSSIAPSILQSLSDQNPTGFELDNQEAFKFLTETVPALEEAGFAVLVPKWWTDQGRKRLKLTGSGFRLDAPGSDASDGLGRETRFSLQSLIKFDWRVSIGDAALTLAELEALASLKSPLINIRGEWVHVNAKDIQAIIQFIKRKGGVSATLQEVIRYAIGAEIPVETSSGVSVDIQAEGWLSELLNELQSPAHFAELSPATIFNGTLRPYQKRGFSWLHFLSGWGLGACLADDMGLGKTIQTLALVQKRKEETGRNPVLLICPTSVVDNWRKEAERFTPDLLVHVHHGGKRTKGLSFRQVVMNHDIVISSYSLLDRDKQFLMDVAWSGVILDEAQNIKNPESKQAKAAGEISCGYKIALTGTPVENSVGDLWSIMNFLNPGLLGTQKAFRSDFFEPIQFARDQEVKEKLQSIVQPFILRRLKTDKKIIDDLPEKQEMNVFCSLTKEQASLYRAVTKDLQNELNSVTSSGRSALVLSAMMRLKQICNHPAQYLGDKFGLGGRSGKFARLEEMLEEVLTCQDKSLIFTQFAQMGGMIQQYFEERFGQEVLFLHGGTNIKHRTEMVEKFQAPGGPSLFVLSLKAGGTGLNLTAASHVFHFDRWWNPAVENQATDRAYRIGQMKNVQVHKFVCAGTLEEKIDALIRSKQELAEDVIGTGEGWLTKLSNDDLRNVFALSQEVFVE